MGIMVCSGLSLGGSPALAHTASSIGRSLAADIHSGRYQPSEMLPSERDLCEEYAVGRNVIREAITILQGMGLVDQSKGKRPRVVSPTLSKVIEGVGQAAQYFFSGSEGLAHLEQARLFLETSLLRYATEHATNAQVGKLIEAIEVCEQGIGEVDAFRDADVQFHRVLAEIPGNPIFVALCDALFRWLANFHIDLVSRPGLENLTIAEHRGILNAIEKGDQEAAGIAMRDHLYRANNLYHQSHFQPDKVARSA